MAMLACALTMQPCAAQTADGPVTVVVAITLEASTTPTEALAAMNGMRAMMKKQPGYVSEEFLQNLNPSNTPQYVHVSRWTSMVQWAALFRASAFSQLSAHGSQHYTISTSAFVSAK